MRIALVHPHSWPDVRRGAERYVADLAWYLARADQEVDVITGTLEAPSVTSVDGTTIRRRRHLTLPMLSERFTPTEMFGAVALSALLRRRYDVVHAFTPTCAIAGVMARQRTVYTELGHPTDPRRVQRRRAWHAAVRRSDAVTALSSSAAESIRALSGRKPDVLRPGTRLDAFAPDLAPRTGPLRVLFSGTLDAGYKGLPALMRAFELLLARQPDARLRLSGSGDHTWALRRAGVTPATEAAIDVLGVGGLEELPDRYRSASMTVLPSTNEAFGLVLVESLACGTPVVCVAGAGSEEVIDDPAVGRAVVRRDPALIADAIEEVAVLAADPMTPARCRAHAERFSWDALGPQHLELYEDVAQRSTAWWRR